MKNSIREKRETQKEEISLSESLAERLLNWYDSGHRSLPWREDPNPYYVWVSEIMLQQTRVEVVKPYFTRFVTALPDIPALANASEEQLLKLWEGLGYYRRVRNLQKAAREIMEQYQGVMPKTYPQLRQLAGIGEYTAGAIASIAFGAPTPAVDGNVLRVLARVTEEERCVDSTTVKQEMRRALAQIYPKTRCGDFTQSLMELGAMVCLPNGAPRCEACPLSDCCMAHLHQSTDLYPVRAEKKPRTIEKRTVLLLRNKNTMAVGKRSDQGLLAGLWELPNEEGWLDEKEIKALVLAMGLTPKSITKAKDAKHIFTHIEWHMKLWLIDCKGTGAGLEWVTKEDLKATVSLPSAFRVAKPEQYL